jgi:gamma-glutamyltranspeptidase/glutathione hydrolase
MKKCLFVLLLVLALMAASFNGSYAEEKGQIDLIRPFKSYGHVYPPGPNNIEAMRPVVYGEHGVVSAEHYRATLAGIDIFQKGGNAFDAGVAAAMAQKTTTMGWAGWGGVAPLILYSVREGQVITRIGAGTAPAKATLENYLEHGKEEAHSILVPADVDVWLAALDRFGTMSFEEVAQYALDLAENGYHLYPRQKWLLDTSEKQILKWPYNVEFWYQHGVGKQQLGDLMVNKDLGKLIRYMIDAERRTLAAGGTRSDGIWAARNAFYKGEPAKAVDKFHKEYVDGQMTYEDMANYQGRWDIPLHTNYRGYDVYTCRGWSQGPRMILFLNMLENFDLKALGYNTPEYIHLISQVIDLGMSDCHKYIGDPDFVDIPKALYSKEYARERIKLIDMQKAFQDMPPWGDPWNMKNIAPDSPTKFTMRDDLKQFAVAEANWAKVRFFDTTSVSVMDAEGNLFSMTESDGFMTVPMIPGWGFGLGSRGTQFNLDPNLANVVAPGKRPRNTNTPFIAMKDGKPFMGFSTSGGDQQAQSLLQVFLNVIEWGMNPQRAVDQPRFGSYNFPGTGSEINTNPTQVNLEARFPEETAKALEKIGHKVVWWGLWDWAACAPTVTYRDPETGVLIAAGAVTREIYPLGY